jgi:uncharacterized membrane protein YciS (DUF1049 family)
MKFRLLFSCLLISLHVSSQDKNDSTEIGFNAMIPDSTTQLSTQQSTMVVMQQGTIIKTHPSRVF